MTPHLRRPLRGDWIRYRIVLGADAPSYQRRALWAGIHFFMLLLAVVLSTGCGSTPAAPEVVVYVAVDRGHAEPILKQFETNTGIHVRAIYDAEAAKTTGLVTRLLTEAERPRCDVFWNNELAQTCLLADRGILQPYVSPAASDIPDRWKESQGLWTGVATRARVIVYNTQYVSKAQAPKSLFDLVKPEWRGKVAIANPQFGTTRTHVAALFAALRPEPAQRFLQELLANDVRIVDGNAMVKNLVARRHPDASPIYVGLTDTDDVLAGIAAGEPVDMIHPDQDTIGTLVVPSSVCLVKGAPHPAQARALIDKLVGPGVESKLTTLGYHRVRPADRNQDSDSIRALAVTPEDIFQQLDASSRWTQEHFHP